MRVQIVFETLTAASAIIKNVPLYYSVLPRGIASQSKLCYKVLLPILRAHPLGCKKFRLGCLLYVDVLNILAIFQNETNQFSYLQLSPRRTTKNVTKCFSSCLDSKRGITETGIRNYNPKRVFSLFFHLTCLMHVTRTFPPSTSPAPPHFCFLW